MKRSIKCMDLTCDNKAVVKEATSGKMLCGFCYIMLDRKDPSETFIR